ncbi:heterokaryon incompatibility protein-domain-containing protein [Stachybotrys elegans]|uniref:Heterokaryon incompatibility protein-domain-containing protein n=1 Tax=Stachybotrys elegans TaxID=80388 RepID=A0A8K0SHE2_9HYPO|nr:heterokaryon incompatibility protein-domain-containing protein [Stachybotrys elegans]
MGNSSSKGDSSPAEDLVCLSCRQRRFSFDSFPWQRRVSYTTTWDDILNANQKGCAWCDMVFAQIDLALCMMREGDQTRCQGTPESIEKTIRQICHDKLNVTVSIRNTIDITGSTDGKIDNAEGQELIIVYESASDGRVLDMWFVPICTASDVPAAPFISLRPLVYQMSSVGTFRLARSLLDECIRRKEGHENCPGYTQSTLPTRVIDCENPNTPKLRIDGSKIEASYVALSYVWGEDQLQKTTKHNIDRYITTGLDMDRTPQTVKDAVRVTRELGVRYLWIDSYCIIQDSATDKAREIRNMRRIFQHAYLTIIAAKTPKVSVGFLHDCPRPGPTYSVPFYAPDRSVVGTMSLLPHAENNQYEARSEPTNSRGWCLEERILTPRALIYASHTLQFLCQRGVLNLGCSANFARRTALDRLSPRFFLKGGDMSSPDDTTVHELTKLWHRVLWDYTPRRLTSPPDRLKAISGVAEEFCHLLQHSRYIVGLWKHHLLGDLLWMKNFEDPLPSPSIYRAPSWSWASVDGTVSHPASVIGSENAYCVVLECQVELKREDSPFGEIKGGHLKVCGRLTKMNWNSSRHLLYGPTPEGVDSVIIGGAYPDRLEDVRVHQMQEEDEEEDVKKEEVWALPLVIKHPEKTMFTSRQEVEKLPEMFGILLKEVGGHDNDMKVECFRRVAAFRCRMQREVQGEFEQVAERIVTIY